MAVGFSGVDPAGQPTDVVLDDGRWTALLFLSSACAGCADLWAGAGTVAGEDRALSVVVVTRSPITEDRGVVASLAPPGVSVVMSDEAFRAYRVAGAPFYAVVGGTPSRVADEGVLMDLEQVRGAVQRVGGTEAVGHAGNGAAGED